MSKLNIFISWSKPLAGEIAKCVLNLLKEILNKSEINIFVSCSKTHGIDAGENFHIKLKEELEQSNFGILILTNHNRNAPWLMFEAGALSKEKNSNVIPILFERHKNKRESPILGLNYVDFSINGFETLIATIKKASLQLKNPDLEEEDMVLLVKNAPNMLAPHWYKFSHEVNDIIHNYVETVEDINDDVMNLMMDENAYDFMLSKREDHLLSLINQLDADESSKRIIIFGGISTILREEKTIKAFARWLLNDHNPKLFICHETKEALIERSKYLNEDIIDTDISREEKAKEKINKINKMKNTLINNVAPAVANRLFFIELPTMLGSFITIQGITMYLTPALDKRSSDTFTFKLKNSKLNEQLLDFITNQIYNNTNDSKMLLEEIKIMKQEMKD